MAQASANSSSADQYRVSKLLNELSDPFQIKRSAHRNSIIVQTSPERLHESLNDKPITKVNELKSFDGTVLYLAYGSNLCAETFQGRRGIRPISAVNVVVPALQMTFDLPGIPYSEPCFANTRRRNQTIPTHVTEKSSLWTADYHKDRWQKGLVGVVYEVTKEDYTHIIATEGGGSAYQDVLVDCYKLSNNIRIPVPEHPTGIPFKAHTLFAPSDEEGRTTRPDPSWAQPSARYKKLIVDGSDEHDFPLDYKEYLHGIRSYTITSQKQRVGQFIFLSVWTPITSFLFGNAKLFADKDGRYPPWLVTLLAAMFEGMWASYDRFFKGTFGEGERTVDKEQLSVTGTAKIWPQRDNYGSIEAKSLV